VADGSKMDGGPRGGTWPPPGAASELDSAVLLGALQAASAWLDAHVEAVNALNVFPVPDGDTGTNMSLTMRAGLAEVGSHDHASAGELTQWVAHGALMGARGNSGVILSQILRGLARSLDEKAHVTASDLAQALKEGVVTAYKGVMRPVEGTILTVVREAADAACDAVAMGGNLLEMLDHTVSEARSSLARTPQLLSVLAEAGVVDAGGQGLVLILEGMLKYLRGESVAASSTPLTGVVHAHAVEGEYGYDTQFIIKGTDLDVALIRTCIAEMGDSVLVVGDERIVKVHVHSDHPGEIVEYGLGCGQLDEVIIENMQLQYEEFRAAAASKATDTGLQSSAPPSTQVGAGGEIAVIAVASGDGLVRVFESLGADAVVPGGQTMNPSTLDLLTAVDRVVADKVILLPNNGNIILAANQAKELSAKQVAVVPTKTVPQGVSALLAFSGQADLDDNVRLMAEASANVETIEITRAVRTTQINGLSILEGQFIGLVNDNLVMVADDIASLAMGLLEHIAADQFEIVTIFRGEDVSEQEAQALADSVSTDYPDLEIEVLDGGQPHYYFIISAE
jgi:DAK2 domain fusion protein YloV